MIKPIKLPSTNGCVCNCLVKESGETKISVARYSNGPCHIEVLDGNIGTQTITLTPQQAIDLSMYILMNVPNEKMPKIDFK
jgi:hypothetical protein